MKAINQKPQGFIAIVSLLIVATVSMFIAMGMLLDGVSNASLSISSVNYETARINANTCLQEILIKIKYEETYSNPISYTLKSGDTCSATIVWFSPQQVAPGIVERLADLDVAGVSSGFTRNFRYDLRVARYDVNHSDGSFEYMNTIEFTSITEI